MAKRNPKALALLKRALRESVLAGPAKRKARDDDDGDHEYRGDGDHRGPKSERRSERRPAEKEIKPKGYADAVTKK